MKYFLVGAGGEVLLYETKSSNIWWPDINRYAMKKDVSRRVIGRYAQRGSGKILHGSQKTEILLCVCRPDLLLRPVFPANFQRRIRNITRFDFVSPILHGDHKSGFLRVWRRSSCNPVPGRMHFGSGVRRRHVAQWILLRRVGIHLWARLERFRSEGSRTRFATGFSGWLLLGFKPRTKTATTRAKNTKLSAKIAQTGKLRSTGAMESSALAASLFCSFWSQNAKTPIG